MFSSLQYVVCLVCVSASASATPVAENAQRFFEKPFVLAAHRGGRTLWPENTLLAFTKAAERWPDVLLESDAHLTTDGHVVLLHDGSVDRTTDGEGAVSQMSLAEVKALDAGYKFTPDGGATFPFRGQGLTIPTFEEVLEALPDTRFLVEFKPGSKTVEPMLALLKRLDAFHRVILASFVPGVMTRVRELEPRALTCFGVESGMNMIKVLREGDWAAYQPPDFLLAIDRDMMNRFNITPEVITALHAKGVPVQLHTINRREEMVELLDMGVDSILTDQPDLLSEVLAERAARVAQSQK